MMVNRAYRLLATLTIFSILVNASLIGLAELATPVAASTPPSGLYFDHVVVIMLENEGIGDICGGNPPPCNGANTPYLSSLANSYGISQQDLALINTSWPDYYGIIGASIFGCPTNCYPPPGSVTATNLVDRFEAAGVTWKGYFENQPMSAGCATSNSAPYTFIHNGFVLFQDITSNTARCNKLVLANPSGCTVTDCALINDLNSGSAPNFMWLTPSYCDNMQGSSVCTNGCTSDGSTTCMKDGDNYLKSLVPSILSSAAFQSQRSALFITFDEGMGYCPLNNSSENCVYAVWAGPVAKTNYFSPNLYTHYSLTKTIETNWNLAALTSNDAGATAMAEFFTTMATKPDFSISASPASLSTVPGSKASATVTVSSLGGFSGTINLSNSVSPSGPTATLSATTLNLSSGGTATSTLNFQSATVGNYTDTVVGTSGNLTHTASVQFNVKIAPDFQITPNPSVLSEVPGASQSSTLTLTSLNGFSGQVSLTATVSAGGFGVQISPNNPSLSSGGSATSTLTITAPNNAIPDTYLVTVKAASGSITHTLSIPLSITRFTVSVNPGSLTFVAGQTGTFNVVLGSVNGFNSTVALSVQSSNTKLVATLASSTVFVPAGSTVSTTLSLASTAAGSYTVTITGTYGKLVVKTPNISVIVGTGKDLELSANPIFMTTQQATTVTSTITVASINGLSGTVNLKGSVSPAGPAITLSSPSVTLSSGGTTTFTVTIKISGSVPVGIYSITLTGTSGPSRTVILSLYVSKPFPDFSMSATSPTGIAGSSATSTISITYLNGFTGTVTLTSSIPTGLSCGTISPSSVSNSATATITCSSTAINTYSVSLTGTGGGFVHSAVATFTFLAGQDFSINSTSPVSSTINTPTNSTITVTALNGFNGTVNLSTSTSPSTGLTVNCNPLSIPGGSGSSICSLNSSTPGNYTVTVTGTSGSLSHSASISATFTQTAQPDFTISSNPTSITLNTGASGTSTVNIASQNGFTGNVTLATTTNSTNLVCTLSLSNISGGSGTSTLTCSGSAAANYQVTVTGASGSLSHSTTVFYSVQDFGVSANPTSVTLVAGSSGSSTLTTIPINGFTGSVDLSVTTNSTGLSCTLSPATISGGSGSSTLSCTSASPNNYLATVTGTSNNLSHSTAVTFHVTSTPDFSLSSNPSSLTVVQGSSGQATITVTSFNSFAGTVTLTVSVSPQGPVVGLNPQSVTLVANGAGSSTLSVASSGAVPGTYTLNVTGSSGSLSHSVLVTVTVTPPPSPSYALVVSYEGYVYKLYPNNTFVRIAQPVTTQLRAVAWKPDGSYALIVGDSAVLLKYDGTSFTTISTGFNSTTSFLSIAWRPDGSYALIGGSNGALLKYDGTTATRISNPYIAYYRAMSWNPSGSQALLVGYFGGIYLYTASTNQVSQLSSPTGNDLAAVAWNPNGSYALLAGSSGTILRYDGTGFQTLSTAGVYNTSLTIRYISFNQSGGNALLVGDSGLVLNYDGTTLTALPTITSSILYSVSWSNGTAYIVGGHGAILTYSAGVLSSIPSGFDSGFRGIAWKPS